MCFHCPAHFALHESNHPQDIQVTVTLCKHGNLKKISNSLRENPSYKFWQQTVGSLDSNLLITFKCKVKGHG